MRIYVGTSVRTIKNKHNQGMENDNFVTGMFGFNQYCLQGEVLEVQNMGKAFRLNAYIDVEQCVVMSLCRCRYG